MSKPTPFYDPFKSYDDNCNEGPFGLFANPSDDDDSQEPTKKFLGHQINLPFGIPAGPLPNSKFVIGAFKMGFDLPYYKTIRTRAHGCGEYPNVIPVKVDGDLTLEIASQGLIQDEDFQEPIAITNSFGVPSLEPDVWQPDMKKSVEAAGKGQVMIASFQGTNDGRGVDAFVEDQVLGARLVLETGAKILELNLSCPNEGKKNLLCHDIDLVEKITDKIKNEIGDTPLFVKIAYFANQEALVDFVKRMSKIIQGFSVINTIAAPVRKSNGEQALPGEGRLVSGVCGPPIKWAGLEMVKRVAKMRSELGKDFVIIGSGGVTKAEDYQEFINAGADAVTSATGAMWNPNLAREIKKVVL